MLTHFLASGNTNHSDDNSKSPLPSFVNTTILADKTVGSFETSQSFNVTPPSGGFEPNFFDNDNLETNNVSVPPSDNGTVENSSSGALQQNLFDSLESHAHINLSPERNNHDNNSNFVNSTATLSPPTFQSAASESPSQMSWSAAPVNNSAANSPAANEVSPIPFQHDGSIDTPTNFAAV